MDNVSLGFKCSKLLVVGSCGMFSGWSWRVERGVDGLFDDCSRGPAFVSCGSYTIFKGSSSLFGLGGKEGPRELREPEPAGARGVMGLLDVWLC